MNLKGRGNWYIALFSLLASALIPYFIITPNYFPFLGLSLSCILFATLLFVAKKDKSRFHTFLFICSLSVAIFLITRSQPFLTFLNILGWFYAAALLGIVNQRHRLSFTTMLLAPFAFFFGGLTTSNTAYTLTIKNAIKKTYPSNATRTSNIIQSVAITLLLLIIIVPLLASANPFFNTLVGDFFKLFNIEHILQTLFGDLFGLYVMRFLLFLILVTLIPRLLTFANKEALHLETAFERVVTFNHLLMPKMVIAIVLAIFFVTQAQLYFATDTTLTAIGYSNSRYAREVFGQLTVVTAIIFALIYLDKDKSSKAKYTTYLLVVQGLFLNAIALKSVYDYSAKFGFTHKRLYGYTGVVWLFGALTLFINNYVNKLNKHVFVEQIAALTAIILIGINLANFDYLIYHYAKASTNEGVDHYYLSKLSPDAHSYKEQLEAIVYDPALEQHYNLTVPAARNITNHIIWLRKKYAKFSWQTFNISEYREYETVKDIPIEQYEQMLNKLFLPPPGYQYTLPTPRN